MTVHPPHPFNPFDLVLSTHSIHLVTDAARRSARAAAGTAHCTISTNRDEEGQTGTDRDRQGQIGDEEKPEGNLTVHSTAHEITSQQQEQEQEQPQLQPRGNTGQYNGVV